MDSEYDLHLYRTVRCPPMTAHPCLIWNEWVYENNECKCVIVHKLKQDMYYIDVNWLYVNMDQHYNVYNICKFTRNETLPFIDEEGKVLYAKPSEVDYDNRLVKGHYHPKFLPRLK